MKGECDFHLQYQCYPVPTVLHGFGSAHHQKRLCTMCWFPAHNHQTSSSPVLITKREDIIRGNKHIVLTNSIEYLHVADFRMSSLQYTVYLHHPVCYTLMRHLAIIEFQSSSQASGRRVWEYITGFSFDLPDPIIIKRGHLRVT